MCVCIYIYICICISIYISLSIHIYIYICICIHIVWYNTVQHNVVCYNTVYVIGTMCIYIYIYMCMYVCIYIYIYIYTHICMYVSIHRDNLRGPLFRAPPHDMLICPHLALMHTSKCKPAIERGRRDAQARPRRADHRPARRLRCHGHGLHGAHVRAGHGQHWRRDARDALRHSGTIYIYIYIYTYIYTHICHIISSDSSHIYIYIYIYI